MIRIYEQDGHVKTSIRLFVEKEPNSRKWAIYCECFNPITFEFDVVKYYDLKYHTYRTKKAAFDAREHISKKIPLKQDWYTVTRGWVEQKAKQEGWAVTFV